MGVPTTFTRLASQLVRGFGADKRRDDSWVLRNGDSSVVAEVLIRPNRGVRINLRSELPSDAPRAVLALFKPTRSQGQWASHAYVTASDMDVARRGLELALDASVTTARLDRRAWTKREDKLVLARAESDTALAVRLGRSRQAVASRRHTLMTKVAA